MPPGLSTRKPTARSSRPPTTCFASSTLDIDTKPVSNSAGAHETDVAARNQNEPCFVANTNLINGYMNVFVKHPGFFPTILLQSHAGHRFSNFVLCCPTGANSHYKLPPHHGQPRAIAG